MRKAAKLLPAGRRSVSRPAFSGTSQGRTVWRSAALAGLVLSAANPLCGADLPVKGIAKGSFRIAYDQQDITGLADPQDPFGAQLLAPE